jgi:transposase
VLTLPPTVRIYVATAPVDMRKSFDGLAATTRGGLGADPLSGALFVYRNRAATLVKILWWDRAGWCLFAKRLERGTFRWPAAGAAAASLTLEAAELAWLLEGLDLQTVRRPPRWTPGSIAAPA